ncbi:MAG: LysR family transcriptional regulator [Pseudomonadales bacterium]|nr:LysR family transcriptional regulator [Pseudomonadales bacterium]
MPDSVQRLLSRLSFRQLQVFLAVYQLRNYSKAGDQLGLTQPAVSSQVRQLEHALGHPVFEYVGRKLYCTAVGERLASCINIMFGELRSLQNELILMGSQVTGDLHISAVDTAHCVLPWLLPDFIKDHPGVQVHVRLVRRTEVLKRLQENVDHLAVMGMAPADRSLATLPFLDNELIPVVAPDHPVLACASPTIPQFLSAGLIVREEESGTRQALELWARQSRVSLEPVLQIDSNDGLKHAVMAGLGVTVLPRLTAISELNAGTLREVRLEGFPLRRSWCLGYLSEKQPTPAMKAFIDHIQTQIEPLETAFRNRGQLTF